MTVETLNRACLLLSKMPSSIPWSSEQIAKYEAGLQPLPDYVVADLIHQAVHLFDERPSVAMLVRLGTELMNKPIPPPSAAWQEVETLLMTCGLYCDPDPFKPNIYREGEPHFSHTLIGRTIKQMGGWRAVCTSDAGLDHLRERFRNLYNDLIDRSTREMTDAPPVNSAKRVPPRRRRRVAMGKRQ